MSTLEFDLTVSADGYTSAPDRVVISVFEDKNHAFFVAPTGDDANAGTRAAPFKTIQKGITTASAQGLGADVYVQKTASGYSGTITLASDVSLYGGYDQTWLRTSAGSQLVASQIGMTGTSVFDVTIDGFLMNVSDAIGESQSAFGIFLNSPGSGVVIQNDNLQIGKGGNGHNQPATSFTFGPPGFAGSNGGAGEADGTHAGSGGSGGSGSADGGAAGGAGGAGGVTTSAGQAGQPGGGTPSSAGGFGGASGNPGGSGSNGNAGSTGLKGFNGGGGSFFGAVVGGAYIPVSGFNGGTGQNRGTGGGGGGGGGGQDCFFCLDGSGNGGGGGGGGGGLGTGGQGGGGGGGSFGMFIVGASGTVYISNVHTFTGQGGNGGAGGVGRSGRHWWKHGHHRSRSRREWRKGRRRRRRRCRWWRRRRPVYLHLGGRQRRFNYVWRQHVLQRRWRRRRNESRGLAVNWANRPDRWLCKDVTCTRLAIPLLGLVPRLALLGRRNNRIFRR